MLKSSFWASIKRPDAMYCTVQKRRCEVVERRIAVNCWRSDITHLDSTTNVRDHLQSGQELSIVRSCKGQRGLEESSFKLIVLAGKGMRGRGEVTARGAHAISVIHHSVCRKNGRFWVVWMIGKIGIVECLLRRMRSVTQHPPYIPIDKAGRHNVTSYLPYRPLGPPILTGRFRCLIAVRSASNLRVDRFGTSVAWQPSAAPCLLDSWRAISAAHLTLH
jgi:hypothetical protein